MKNIFKILLCSILMLSYVAGAQATFKYYNPAHFKGYSIVFTANYKSDFSTGEIKYPFTATKQDIDTAESIFMKRYNVDINEKGAYIVAKNPVKFYRNYKRQYLGLINSRNEKLVFIQMLKVNKRSDFKEHYEWWESELWVGTGDFFERNTVRFTVNLTTGVLKVY